MFYEYSELWHLSINFDKTKIMIFGTRQDQHFNFNLGGHKIDICTDFKYLNVIFSRNRHFHLTVKQARKAMHVLLKQICNLDIPIDLQLYLLDNVILPIALYGCEIWGFENIQLIENLHNDFIRQIINLRKSTPIYMLHAELGRHPIQINIKSRMIGFWLLIVNGKESKLSKSLYSIMLKEHEKGSYNFKWIRCINDMHVAVGRPDIFKNEPVNNPNSMKMDISRKLSDLYIQEWNKKSNVFSKGKQYFLFKDNLNSEKKIFD